MKDLNTIGEELFDKIRGRFPSVTIGGEDGKTTNEPTDARFFDFEYQESGRPLGNVSVSISEDDGLTVIYSKDIVANEDSATKNTWFEFLKDLRQFSKKRLMDFDVRDITKSNLTKRDYKFLANRRFGDSNMNESKLYGTARTSYQKVGEARIMIKHTENVNLEASNPRTKKIGTIYIESAGGERFKYPFKHLSGARAMARHVAEGGNLYDDFGSHIIGLSEEMSKLRKFKSYMGRSAVMAESLSEYVDVVKDRINTVRKTITSLQKPKFYAEAFAAYEAPILEDVPADVAENWTDQLTIKQFNEELADVFPYIYKLVSEATKAKELGPDDLDEGASQKELGRLKDKYSKAEKKTKEEIAVEQGFEEMMGQFGEAVVDGEITKDSVKKSALELLVDIAKTSKQYKGEITKDQVHYLGSLIHDFDMAGIETEKYSEIEKLFRTASKTNKADMSMIQPAYAQAKTLDEGLGEDDIEEAYIKTRKDAVDVLGALRAMGKKIETGQGDDQGNLANRYVNNVWDVFTWLQNKTQDFNGMDKNAKAAIDAMMKLRGEAKKLETEPGSGKNGKFGNSIVNTLYPVMELINGMKLEGEKEASESEYDASDIMSEDPPIGIDFDFDNLSKVDWDNHSDEAVNGFISHLENLDFEDGVDVSDTGYSGSYRKAAKWVEDNVLSKRKKEGDEIDGPDGEKIKLEKEDEKTPLGEFILSYFDKESGQFPKGETAVLTMVEKDYGEQFINPAKSFIEQVSAKFEEYQMQAHPQQMEADDEDDDEDENDDLFKDDEFTAMDQEDDDEVNKHFDRVRQLAGLR